MAEKADAHRRRALRRFQDGVFAGERGLDELPFAGAKSTLPRADGPGCRATTWAARRNGRLPSRM